MQLSLWPDGTFDSRSTRRYQRDGLYQDYLQTPQWRMRRMETIESQRYRCAGCGSQERLQVHHRTYRNLRNEFPSDLLALCRQCHRHEHRDWA